VFQTQTFDGESGSGGGSGHKCSADCLWKGDRTVTGMLWTTLNDMPQYT